MNKLLVASMIVASSAFSFAAHAASQGSLGSTSTGSVQVTATGDLLPRQVQVLNLSDLSITNATRAEVNSTNPGASISFCLVDTYGGQVALTVSNSVGFSSSNGWLLSVSPTVAYEVTIRDTSNATQYGVSGAGSNSFNATVPAGVSLTSPAACSGGNNLKLHAVLNAALPATNPAATYTSTVTIVATPT